MRRLVGALLALLLVTGCGATSSSGSSSTLTVYAAASLQRGFTAIGQRFEAEHPGTKVGFVFAGSADLISQLDAGAPADVLATADEATMTKASAKNLVGSPRPFATNNLVIATAPGNPKRIAGLADLAGPGTTVALCAAQVPCGSAAVTVLQLARVQLRPVTEENSVSGVLTKVMAGEVDAGLVYRTDARTAGDTPGSADKVTAIDFPESVQVTNVYPIAVTRGVRERERAQEFADWVVSPAGTAVLREAGFGAPPR